MCPDKMPGGRTHEGAARATQPSEKTRRCSRRMNEFRPSTTGSRTPCTPPASTASPCRAAASTACSSSCAASGVSTAPRPRERAARPVGPQRVFHRKRGNKQPTDSCFPPAGSLNSLSAVWFHRQLHSEIALRRSHECDGPLHPRPSADPRVRGNPAPGHGPNLSCLASSGGGLGERARPDSSGARGAAPDLSH